MSALLPALLVGLFASWSGTFHGGASGYGALVADLAVLLLSLAAVCRPWDPLRVAPRAHLLAWALLAVLAASVLASPVSRAGVELLVVVPAFLLAPAAIERLWRDARRRTAGRRALTALTGVVAAWGLFDAGWSGSWRAAAPLGHHGALALWLLLTLPFAAVTVRDRGAWRVVGACATAAAAAAVLATRSLVGVAFLVAQAAMLLRSSWRATGGAPPHERDPGGVAPEPLRGAAGSRRLALPSRGAWILAGLAAVALALLGPRGIAIVRGEDPSVAARAAYLAAGVDGVLERPALGWGLGSVGWTVADGLTPIPGRNPPGEIVSYLHFLPLDVGYQVGLAGLLLAAAVVAAFLGARWRERATTSDPALRDAAFAALVPGIAAACLAGFPPLPAHLLAVAVAAGAALAAGSPAPLIGRRERRLGRLAIVLYAGVALAALAPARWAQIQYDEARSAERPHPFLRAAARADPAFPLYQARLAWSVPSQDGADAPPAAAESSLRAAERARGVAVLWLAAGLLGEDAGAPWSARALRRACDLDPLGALAPFRLAAVESDPSVAAIAGARALLAEPRLAAAMEWRQRAALYARALDELAVWPGVDPAWRRRLVAVLRALPAARGAATRPFHLELDGDAQTSLSLFVFRRLPWPAALGAVDLDVERLRRVAPLGSAAQRSDTEPWAFPRNGCRGGEPPRSPEQRARP